MYRNHITKREFSRRLGGAPTRRAVLAVFPTALGASCLVSSAARAGDERIVVVTSFPEELTTRYETEFEKANPGIHVQFVWKQSRDALVELTKPDQGGADVYWAPSLGNFPTLRDRGAFQKLSVDRAALPGRLGDQLLSDPAGMFEAYDVAGYGIIVDPAALKRRELPEPKFWSDLASPIYGGQIVMPIPSKVGFAPALYDIVLQSEGWDRGWALISEIAGNAELLSSGNAPTSVVRDGRAALGLTIDFFAIGAQANGQAVSFVYPTRTAFLPAHIAITASTRHYEAAKAFVDFTLSQQGQKLLMEADSSRHPARPEAYEGKARYVVDPFALPKYSFFPYDSEIGRRRPGLVSILFDLAVTERHAELVALWRAIHRAEAKLASAPDADTSAKIAEARRLAGAVPVSAAEASDSAFLERFAGRDTKDQACAAQWRGEISAARARALELVQSSEPKP
jgi:phosphoglycerate transport regulatory protein PgtC